MNLTELIQLERPIIFFDTETTGPEPATDRIVELGFIQIKPDGVVKEWQSYINPEVPIPHEASHGNGGDYHGHGVTDAVVQGCRHCGQSRDSHEAEHQFNGWPTFRELAPSLMKGFVDCDYGGFNIKTFDLPLFVAEFTRAGYPTWSYEGAGIIDGYRLWQLGSPRTLTDAVEEFLQRKHEGAHTALDDIRASLEVVLRQIQRWGKLPRDIRKLHDAQWPRDPNALDPDGKIIWRDGVAVMNFGKKWKGMRLDMMTRRDLDWIAGPTTTFSPQVKQICLDAWNGKYPTRG
jgi:DNA polymerase-3 subunit epsilon